MNGIILAAGLGNRMKPITDVTPKPLLRIVNRTILELGIRHLQRVGIEKIGINLFYKPDIIEKYLEQFADFVHTVREKTLRGTGGALHNFKDFLKGDFIIHNCDVISDIDLEKAIAFHKQNTPIATLILTKNEGTDCVRIDADGLIREFSSATGDMLHTFTGVAIVSERIFSYLPERETFSMIEVYKSVLAAGESLRGLPTQEHWYDIGTHRKYWQVHHDILTGSISLPDVDAASPCYVDSTSDVRTRHLNGFVSIQPRCFIGENVSLMNAVVLSDSRILDGSFSNCLVSDKYCINLNPA